MSDEEFAQAEKETNAFIERMAESNGLVKVGVVGVDSGQVIICDPGYLDGWKKDDKPGSFIETERFRDKTTGKTYAYEGFGIDPKAVDVLFMNWEQPLKDYGGATPNYCRKSGVWEQIESWVSPDAPPKGAFSYGGVCRLTGGFPPYGQLNYELGHEGLGVASRTQFGDGCYPVFAELDGNNQVARLIIDFRPSDYENDMDPKEYLELLKGVKPHEG
jgi:hypothetical protein